MSATTQFKTFADLYNGLLKALRVDSGNSSTIEQAKRYINTAHLDVHLEFSDNVPWAIREHSVSTIPSFVSTIATSSVGVTDPINGSITHDYTGSNTDLDQFFDDQKIAVTSSADGTTVGFEALIDGTPPITPADPQSFPAVGPQILVGDIVRVFQDELLMPTDFLRLAGNQIKISSRVLDLIGRIEFRHRFSGEISIGRPQYATLIDSFDKQSGLEGRKVRLYPIPNTIERVFLSYITKNIVVQSDGKWLTEMAADTDESIMPLRYRHAIFYHALYNWYRDRKDDQRSQEAKAEYIEIMSRVMNDTESGQSNMKIRPNVNSYRRNSSRPYRGAGSRRYDFGRFDRFD